MKENQKEWPEKEGNLEGVVAYKPTPHLKERGKLNSARFACQRTRSQKIGLKMIH